ncbi:hypothetical protein [Peribacillus deserti]|uniref:Uncharacterized protein n=1 Tax=Peribacillus deserti TaxID=673318 RepID=A0A2N5M252_9BACI|nr:hypothetical protein [Peribacillus deserti]PLT28439.1 hypothetical protein CUU66_18530 [Peribacillus deserti]
MANHNNNGRNDEQGGIMGALSQATNSVVQAVRNMTGNDDNGQSQNGQHNNYQNNHHRKNKHGR